MVYERLQNLDPDKAEPEVFKLFFWIPLFVLSIRPGSNRRFLFYTSNGGSWYKESRRINITTSFVALSPCKHAQMERVYVLKHQDRNQTRPCHKSTNQPSRKNLISFSRINKKKRLSIIFFALSAPLSRDRLSKIDLPGLSALKAKPKSQSTQAITSSRNVGNRRNGPSAVGRRR